MHPQLSHCRCHNQLSSPCILKLSCDHFNQSCSAKGRITPAIFTSWGKISILPYMKQNCQTTCVYVTVVFAILWSQGGVGFEYFHDLRRSGCGGKGGADAEENFSEPEQRRSSKMRYRPPLVLWELACRTVLLLQVVPKRIMMPQKCRLQINSCFYIFMLRFFVSWVLWYAAAAHT